jgi:hypothetical protein
LRYGRLKTHLSPLSSFWGVAHFQFFFNFIGGLAGFMGLTIFYDRYKRGHLGWPELVIVI